MENNILLIHLKLCPILSIFWVFMWWAFQIMRFQLLVIFQTFIIIINYSQCSFSVIRNRKSKKNKQHNCQRTKGYNITHKTKDQVTQTLLKLGVNSGAQLR